MGDVRLDRDGALMRFFRFNEVFLMALCRVINLKDIGELKTYKRYIHFSDT